MLPLIHIKRGLELIDTLCGEALHSYFLKIEVESPDGILETQVRHYVSQYNLFSLGGQEQLAIVTNDLFNQVRSQVPSQYSVSVRLVIDRMNSLIMN